MQDPKEHILSIRKKYTGENTTINSDGERVVEHLTQMLTRTISELSKNIYKKDSHFIMELIQNADDNEYKEGVIPTLKIIQDSKRIIFQNNEVGFKKENVESICSISNSTKSIKNGIKGYIGEKGIGFKSVFRVCNEPEIYSNGYQFKFNSNRNLKGKRKEIKLGYILPEWIDNPTVNLLKSYTNIVLPFKESLSIEEQRQLSKINPSLILFLNKLKKLDINDEYGRNRIVVSKSIKENIASLVQTQYISGKKEKSIRNDFVLIDRDNIKVPKVVVAEQRKGITKTRIILAFPLDNKSNLKYDESQLVFSYLPIIHSGFRFLIQADFILTSGRESIDEDNSWNHWIRDEIAITFKSAIEEFKKHPRYKYSFVNFIPFVSETFSDFFKPLADQIVMFCRTAKIMLTESNRWSSPDEVINPEDKERELFKNEWVKSATQKEYINKLSPLNERLISTLEINIFNYDNLYNCLGYFSEIQKMNSDWFVDLFSYLVSQQDPSMLARSIQKIKIIPLKKAKGGKLRWAVPVSDSVFFPIDRQMTYSFEKSINVISNDLYEEINKIKNNSHRKKIVEYLTELGIQRVTPYTIIKNFILRKYETDEWKDYSNDELIDHLIYIKDYWSELKNYHKEILALLKGKNILNCKSIGDGKNYFSKIETVYISDVFKTKYLLEDLLKGINNVWFINERYLNKTLSKNDSKIIKEEKAKEWFNFFKTLGCKDIPEFEDINSEAHVLKLIDSGQPEKIDQLLIIIEKNWVEYKKSMYLPNKVQREWYKKLTQDKIIPVGKKLYFAKEVYIRNEKTKSFFGNFVTFFPRNIFPDFAEKMGFNIIVNSISVIRYLKELTDRKHKISKEKAIQIYKYLLNDNGNLANFNTEKLIFLPANNKWYNKNEIFWADSQNIFGNEYGYCERSYPLVLKEFFVDKIGIDEKPQLKHFINFLKRLEANLGDEDVTTKYKEVIYKIFSEIGSLALKPGIDKNQFKELDGYIWTNKNTFYSNDNDLFFNDNDSLFELYQSEEFIAFFDIPKNLLPKTKYLLSILGIPGISLSVGIDLLNEDQAVLDERLTNKVRRYADTIISLIYSDYTAVHEDQKGTNLLKEFKNIKIYELQELRVNYSLNTILKCASTDSFHKNNSIYLARDSDKISSLAFEISKMLGISSAFEFILLLLTLPKKTIDSLIKQKNLASPLPDEETSFEQIAENNKEEERQEDFKNEYDKNFTNEDGDFSDQCNSDSLLNTQVTRAVSVERWKPNLQPSAISLPIENYIANSDFDIEKNIENRTFLKSPGNRSESNDYSSQALSQQDKDNIGDFGEQVVFNGLVRWLKSKYSDNGFTFYSENQIFRIKDKEKTIAELKWLNSKYIVQEGHDLVLKENGINKYFEVKTTRGDDSIVFTVSPQQWKFMKQEKGAFSIMRVINASATDRNDIRIIEINNPFQLWIEGKLKASPVSIEL